MNWKYESNPSVLKKFPGVLFFSSFWKKSEKKEKKTFAKECTWKAEILHDYLFLFAAELENGLFLTHLKRMQLNPSWSIHAEKYKIATRSTTSITTTHPTLQHTILPTFFSRRRLEKTALLKRYTIQRNIFWVVA